MEALLNSKVELMDALAVNYRNGHKVLLKNLGPLAAFLWLHADELEFSYPDLWEKAGSSMGEAHANPHDLVKAQEARQAAWNLLDAAKLIN